MLRYDLIPRCRHELLRIRELSVYLVVCQVHTLGGLVTILVFSQTVMGSEEAVAH